MMNVAKRLLSLVLVLTLCAAMALPALAGGEEAPSYPYLSVEIDGETEFYDITADASEAGWSWAAATHTLTLNGFSGDNIGFSGGRSANLGFDVKLIINGANALTGSFMLSYLSHFSMTISGTGTLSLGRDLPFLSYLSNSYVINSGHITFSAKTSQPVSDLTLNGGTLELVNTAEMGGGWSITLLDNQKGLLMNGGTLILQNREGAPQSPITYYDVPKINGDWTAYDREGNDISSKIAQSGSKNVVHYIKITSEAGTPAEADPQPTEPEPTEPVAPPTQLVAIPTASAVTVNGGSVAFEAYNIEGSNYFKLRDLAYVLSGSDKQFEVQWDAANQAILLTSGAAYTTDGSEMKSRGEGGKTPVPTTAKTLLDGVEVQLTAYNIDGNNYFKLRDLGQALDFSVVWDAATLTIIIDTNLGYTP